MSRTSNVLLGTLESKVNAMVSPADIRFRAYGSTELWTVADMEDGVKASNNCWDASEAVLERHLSDFQGCMEQAFISGIQTPAGNHYAILCVQGSDEVIIDYTARQFDTDAPYPLIMDAWEWQDWVEGRIGRQGAWMHDASYYGE